jgi:hypothetical protein
MHRQRGDCLGPLIWFYNFFALRTDRLTISPRVASDMSVSAPISEVANETAQLGF